MILHQMLGNGANGGGCGNKKLTIGLDWQSLSSMTSSATSYVSLLSAGVALVATLAAWASIWMQRGNTKRLIRAQLTIASRQSRASVVSASRQRWIDALREDIAEFLSVENAFRSLRSAGSFIASGHDAINAEARALEQKRRLLRKRIELRLNPTEDEHEALLQAMDAYMQTDDGVKEKEVRVRTKEILKLEWERVKREAAGTEPFASPADL